MRTSDRGLQLIAEFEGLRTQLYNDPAGHCTVGYGHLVHLGPCSGAHAGEQRFLAGLTPAQALELLRADVVRYEDGVAAAVGVALNQRLRDEDAQPEG